MSKFECDLVADLLPGYIDRKTSNETNIFVERHIKSCQECRELYEAMIGDVVVADRPVINKRKFRINSIGKMGLIVLGYLVVVVLGLVAFTYIIVNGVL